MHNNGQSHHHQTHLQMSFTSVSAAYAPHLQNGHQHHHHPNFHHSTPIHHPQPMPFAPMVHHNHHLPHPQRLDHNKMSAFEFPATHNTEIYKTANNNNTTNNNNNNNNNSNNNINMTQHSHHHSPSPTQTINSGSSIEPSSEGSPQLIVDNIPTSPLSISNSTNSNENKNLISAQHSGLLDILMNPDKCQVNLEFDIVRN